MNKFFKISILFMFFLGITLFVDSVYAASASISANKTTATVGDTVTVTVSINAAAWNLKVSGATSGSIVGYNPDAENMTTTKTYNISTSSTGTYTVNLTGDITDESASSANSVNKSIIITVNAAQSNTNSNTNSSTSKSNSSTTTKKTTTTTTQTKKNTTVIDPESDKPVETVEEEAIVEELVIKDLLESLSIEGATLSPEFNSEVYEYSVNIKEMDQLNINAKANKEELKVEILGNENLQFGENEIIINLKNTEDTVVATYKLKVIREKTDLEIANEKIQELKTSNKMLNEELKMFYTITLICIITIIVLGINLYTNKRKKSRNII